MAFGIIPFGVFPAGGGAFGGASSAPGYANFLRSLYPDSHYINGMVYTAIVGAIGDALDKLDPYHIGLKSEFSVLTAMGSALDLHGADWGVTRRYSEDDATYRARILAMLPIYANGASEPGISAAVAVFTGAPPHIVDCCTEGWVWGESAWADSVWSDLAGCVTLYIYVSNPNHVAYSHFDMEFAVRRSLPARSRAYLWHDGSDTSSLNQAFNAISTIIG